jgi:hypothetical protein
METIRTIKSYEDLVETIKNESLSMEQITELVSMVLKVWILKDYKSVAELLKDLDEYWLEWKHTNERPIFIKDEFSISDIYNNEDTRTSYPKRHF